MTVQTAPIDLTEYSFKQTCDRGCGREADVMARGCSDVDPVLLCEPCLKRGLDVIHKYVHMYQKHNHRIAICEACYRPILHLETHLEIHTL
jgi:hypothetical protein